MKTQRVVNGARLSVSGQLRATETASNGSPRLGELQLHAAPSTVMIMNVAIALKSAGAPARGGGDGSP